MAFIASDTEDTWLMDAGPSPVFESLSKPTGLHDSLDLDRSDDDAENVAELTGTGTGTMIPTRSNAVLAFSYGKEMMFERIWIKPTLINPSFISEDIAYDIYTWNAWLDRSVEWTAESVTGELEGVAYVRDPLTITIAAFVEITYEMVLYEQGPAVQDTTYTETIDGDDYTIDIDSIRVIGFDPEPDWASRVRLSYEFETAMFANERLHEQRRPMRTRVRRGLRATYLTTDVEAQKLRNMLMYGHDKTFACPIYAEKLDVVTCTQGTSSIVFSSSTTDKWNLNTQCDRVILVDHENGQNEIKTIDSIAANSIVTSSDIQRAFVPASTLCYPIFIGTLKTAQERYHSNSVLETILTFEEYFGGG